MEDIIGKIGENSMSGFREKIAEQRKSKPKVNWEGKLIDYLEVAKNNPDVATFSPGRIYNTIIKYGIEEIDETKKTQGYEDLVKYKFFEENGIYGSLEPIHDLMRFLKAASKRTETGKRVLALIGPVGSGKCLRGSTKIYNVDDGKFYTIENIVKDRLPISVQSYDENGLPHVETISNYFNNGEKPIYRVTLDNGSYIEATDNHPMLTPGNKWVMISDLNVGDYLVLTRQLEKPKDIVELDEKEVKLYAYYMAEGSTSDGGIGFSNTDPAVIIDFYECAKSIEPKCTLKNYDKEGRNWHLTCGVGTKSGENAIRDFLREWGLQGKLAINKEIDERIFSSTDENITTFLGTIWSCDGYIDKNGYPSYSTSSKKFSDGIRNLLLRIGIQSHTKTKKTKKSDAYPISIYGRENLEKFYYLIVPKMIGSGLKSERYEKIISERSTNASDIIPSEYIYPILKEEYKNNNIRVKVNGIRDHVHRIDYYKRQNISREKLRELGEFSNSKKLVNISNSHFYYRKIKNIEFIGNECSYDIEVPRNHNFVIDGGVITHNSSVVNLIKKALEKDTEPIYVIDECPIHEQPFNAIPEEDREFWSGELGIRIEGSLCPVCQYNIENKWNLIDENGNIQWEEIPVKSVRLSAAKRLGIATFQPSDPRTQDSTELVGRVNMSKMARYGETHPLAFEFNGELEVANRGMIDYVELLKADIRLHHILLTVAQEQLIKAPGFPQIYIDTFVVGHSNEAEFDSFKSEKKNEALHDRMYVVYWPWNLAVNDEVKIYKKLIRESDFAEGIHIAPHTLEIAAQFAILSRLVESAKVSSKIEKMKLYNDECLEGCKHQEINVKQLKEDGRKEKEGRVGISPRFIINALNVSLGQKEGSERKCLNPIDVIRGIRRNFDHHMGITEEEKSEYLNYLLGEKESVSFIFKEVAKKEVTKAFLYAYEDQAQAMFENYIEHVAAYCKKEKVYDSITGEYSSPDEKLMRAIEEIINVPVNSKDTFRNGIFVHKVNALEKGEKFTFKTYKPLEEAIEKKLMSDLKNVVSLTLADPTKSQGEKTKKKREEALKRLQEKGYCEHCAATLLQFVGEILRREN